MRETTGRGIEGGHPNLELMLSGVKPLGETLVEYNPAGALS